MNTYRVSRGKAQLILNLCTRWRLVVNFNLGCFTLGRHSVGPISGMGVLEKRKMSCPYWYLNPRPSSPSHYTHSPTTVLPLYLVLLHNAHTPPPQKKVHCNVTLKVGWICSPEMEYENYSTAQEAFQTYEISLKHQNGQRRWLTTEWITLRMNINWLVRIHMQQLSATFSTSPR
jgi:hypothetical protein